jgi:hypothetical protein
MLGCNKKREGSEGSDERSERREKRWEIIEER